MSRAGARHLDVAPAASPTASTSTSMATCQQPQPHSEEEAHQLYATLNEYLMLEVKFQPKLCLPAESENSEVTIGARDGAAHVLRSLKVWYDLPADVLINAINLFDRFLTKMKVRPCHVPCITVSCMNIALDEYAVDNNVKRNVSIEELVSISQSACTAGDVARMSRVIADKLGLGAGSGAGRACRPVTALHWLRLFRRMLQVETFCEEAELVNLLEIVMCDAMCANARTCELALVLLFHKLEQQIAYWTRVAAEGGAEVPEQVYYLYDCANQLQLHCHMSEPSIVCVRLRLRRAVAQYEARRAQPQRQRLVWRLSERTLKVLRPTDRLTSLLPTIEEQHFAVDATPPRKTRSGSESSEDTSDWPRSPVLPVYCDN